MLAATRDEIDYLRASASEYFVTPDEMVWNYSGVRPLHDDGASGNVVQLYMRMAKGIREGTSVSPDFYVSVKRYEVLDAIQKASDTGIRQNPLRLHSSVTLEEALHLIETEPLLQPNG